MNRTISLLKLFKYVRIGKIQGKHTWIHWLVASVSHVRGCTSATYRDANEVSRF